MSTLLSADVSVFNGSTNTTPVETVTLSTILQRIQDGTYRVHVERLRRYYGAGEEQRYKATKKRSRAFTPCCALQSRAEKVPWEEKLLSTTGLVHLDLDDMEEPEALKQTLRQDTHVVFAFVSPSGAGLKIGIAATGITGPADYKHAWNVVVAAFEARYPGVHVNVDPLLKYLNALCYVSDDPELYTNPQAVPVDIPPYVTTPTKAKRDLRPLNANDEYAQVSSALNSIPNADADYATWLMLGMALHSTTEPWAQNLWEHWSQQSGKFDEREQSSTWRRFHSDGEVTLGSLFHLAKQHGYTPPKKEVPYMAQTLHEHRNGTAAVAEDAPEDAPDLSQRLPRGEYSNTQVFVQAHGESLRWCEAWHSWLVWTGTHWQRDTSGAVLQKAKSTVKAMLRAVELTNDENATAAILKHVNMSLKIAQLEAMVKNARSEPGMTVQPEELDTHPWLLNCANGTLDLRTGTLHPHTQTDMLTKCLDIAYDATARYPTWAAFLERILGGNVDLILFVQRAIGYSLTGSTREQCMFILHGPTKTGKSTFLATIRALLGPYGQQADMSSFMHKEKEEVRNDLADLAGSRVVCALESQEGKRLAESLVKQVTGGVDQLKARFLFQEHFTFRPQFKLFLGTNHKPLIRDTDSAIWERIRLIPFVVQIPKPERDKTLDDKLQGDLPGILAWAIRGCMQWQALGALQEPPAVVDATSGYRTEMDTIARFLDECCVVDKPELPGIKAPLLAMAYLSWCKRTGEFPLTGRALITDLERRGYVRKKGHANQLYWYGIALSSAVNEMSNDGNID